MPSSRWLALIVCVLASSLAIAQALMPEEIQEPGPHRLQLKYFGELRAIGSTVEAHKFPFNFYFSRQLDVSEQQQAKLDQRSIRFERFQDLTVLAITGNYFAAYSADLLDKNARATKTLQDVVLPILQTSVPYFANDDTFDGFAIEVSQHIRRKVMDVPAESAENLLFFFPRDAAQHMASAKTPETMQGALLESKVFFDAEPFNLWVNGGRPSDLPETYANARPWSQSLAPARAPEAPPQPTVSKKLISPVPPRILTPKVLDDLKAEYADDVKRLEHDLADQVHFASYVPTQFIGFHEGAYLQLSMVFEPKVRDDASRYKLAALSFDDQVSHLIRPALAHFQGANDFDGIVFSVIEKYPHQDSSVAVEYFFTLPAMRCYARYDCTGQDLLDSGFLLMNGEGATLNLQTSDASVR